MAEMIVLEQKRVRMRLNDTQKEAWLNLQKQTALTLTKKLKAEISNDILYYETAIRRLKLYPDKK
jgi:plasmid maintenance system antidote protein VapI